MILVCRVCGSRQCIRQLSSLYLILPAMSVAMTIAFSRPYFIVLENGRFIVTCARNDVDSSFVRFLLSARFVANPGADNIFNCSQISRVHSCHHDISYLWGRPVSSRGPGILYFSNLLRWLKRLGNRTLWPCSNLTFRPSPSWYTEGWKHQYAARGGFCACSTQTTVRSKSLLL